MYPDLLSLIIFGFVTAMTPGPNNITSSYSGFNFGYKKTLPLILAVIFGWTLLLILMNTGLILIFRQYPFIQEIIRILGSIFFSLSCIFNIFFQNLQKEAPIKNPISFSKAFILQFINPKSLVVSMTTVSIFIDPENYLRDSFIVISFFFFMAVLSINSWCLMGMYLRNFATSEKFIRNFNYIMSFLLIVCVIMFYV